MKILDEPKGQHQRVRRQRFHASEDLFDRQADGELDVQLPIERLELSANLRFELAIVCGSAAQHEHTPGLRVQLPRDRHRAGRRRAVPQSEQVRLRRALCGVRLPLREGDDRHIREQSVLAQEHERAVRHGEHDADTGLAVLLTQARGPHALFPRTGVTSEIEVLEMEVDLVRRRSPDRVQHALVEAAHPLLVVAVVMQDQDLPKCGLRLRERRRVTHEHDRQSERRGRQAPLHEPILSKARRDRQLLLSAHHAGSRKRDPFWRLLRRTSSMDT